MRRIYKEQAGQLPFRRSRLRAILADDQPILRHGLRVVLDAEADLEVIGEADNVLEALALSRRLLPDVVITDVSFPNSDGFQAISRLRRECAGVRVLLLSGHSCPECMRAAMTDDAAAATRYALDNGLLPFDDEAQEPGPELGSAEAGSSPE